MATRAKVAIVLASTVTAAGLLCLFLGRNAPAPRPLPAVTLPTTQPEVTPEDLDERDVPNLRKEKVTLTAQGERQITVALDRGGSISGRVVDGSGKPVKDARVVPGVGADTIDPSDVVLSGITSLEARTDAGGRYRLTGLPPRKDYRVEASHAEFAPTSLRDLEVAENESLEGADLVLLAGGEIGGRVVDEDGNGIGDSSLWVTRVKDREEDRIAGTDLLPSEPREQPDRKADGDGSYRFTHLAAGAYTLRARDPSSALLPGRREDVEVLEGKALEGVDILLGKGESLAGRVVDTEGNPVAGAEVRASGEASSSARTDDAGNFAITGLQPGKADINVIKKGFETVIEEATVPAEDVVFTMLATGAIIGYVRAADQVAFPEFRLAVRCRLPDGRGSLRYVDVHDPGGRFEVEGEEGVYVLTANVPGFAVARSAEITLAPHERKEGVVIDLPRGERLQGRVVVKGSGEPIADAWISARPPRRTGESFGRGGDVQNAKSRPDGSFVIEGVSAGDLDLEADHRDYTATKLSGLRIETGKPTEVILELGEGGRIRGTVRRRAMPVSGARISAMLHGDFNSREALTDSEGHFDVKGLEEGEYSVTTMAALPSGGHRYVKTVHLVVRDGQAIDVEIEESPRVKLRGRVTAAGSPISGGAVQADRPEAGDSATGAIGPSGEFSLDVEGGGRYFLTVSGGPDLRTGPRCEVMVPEGANETRRDIELPSGEISGLVADAASGSALPKAQVWALPAGASGRSFVALYRFAKSTATTDASGRFVLSNLASGVYTLRAFIDGYADGQVEGVKVDEKSAPAEVRLPLEQGIRLEAKILDPKGQTVSGAMAFLRTTSGDLALLVPAASNDDGIVALQVPGEGAYRLSVLHASHAPWRAEVRVAGDPPQVPVTLKLGGKLRLRVLDRRGKPVEGAEVRVFDGEGEDLIEDLVFLEGELRRTFTTQIDGYLVLDQVVPGSYRVAARRGGGNPTEERIEVVEGRCAETTLTVAD